MLSPSCLGYESSLCPGHSSSYTTYLLAYSSLSYQTDLSQYYNARSQVGLGFFFGFGRAKEYRNTDPSIKEKERHSERKSDTQADLGVQGQPGLLSILGQPVVDMDFSRAANSNLLKN